MKPNSALDQSTSSSARRERCTMQMAAAAEELEGAVSGCHRVHTVRCGSLEAQRRCRVLPVQRKGRARQGPGAQGEALPSRAWSSPKRSVVSRVHRHEGEPMVGQPHRLGSLQMGVAGKHRVQVLARARDEDAPAARRSPRWTASHMSRR